VGKSNKTQQNDSCGKVLDVLET
jgi:hypothetical protein